MKTNIKRSMLLCSTVVLLTAGGATAQTVAELLARVPDLPRPDGAQCISTRTLARIDEAVEALAAHPGPEVDAALAGLTAPERHDAVRRRAARALARTRGASSLGLLRELIDAEPRGSRLTQDLVLAIAHVPGDEGLAALLDLVRTHHDRNVKSVALVGLTKRSEPAAAEELQSIARELSSLGRQANSLLVRQRQAQQ